MRHLSVLRIFEIHNELAAVAKKTENSGKTPASEYPFECQGSLKKQDRRILNSAIALASIDCEEKQAAQ